MKLISILDTETNGLDPKNNQIIEIAIILYDLINAAPVNSFSAIISSEPNPVEHINGIGSSLMKNMTDWKISTNVISEFINKSDIILAHNAVFDKEFFENSFLQNEVYGYPNHFVKPWVCSMNHIKWPKKHTSRSLMAIALAHGVPVIAAHRAMTDCDILARLLTRVHENGTDLIKLMELAMRPRVLVQALVSFDDRQLAKDEFFDWKGDTKQWLKEIPIEDIDALPFKCKILDTKPQTK